MVQTLHMDFEFDEDEILIIEIPFDSVRKSDAKKYSESFLIFWLEKIEMNSTHKVEV